MEQGSRIGWKVFGKWDYGLS